MDEYESLGRLEGAIREEAQRVIAEADPARKNAKQREGAAWQIVEKRAAAAKGCNQGYTPLREV